MNVVGFTGSPRMNGSTAWAVKTILQGAVSSGADAALFQAGELEIKPCHACGGCNNFRGCVMKDDMERIYGAIAEADALVFGSPLYMGQMSAQGKAFLDRLYAVISPKFSPRYQEKYAGKRLVLAFTQGNPDTHRFQEYYEYTKNMFKTLEFDIKGMVVIAGTRGEPAEKQLGLYDALIGVGARLVN